MTGKHSLLFKEFAVRISSGELLPGARLPSESELARSYKLSRSSVREGLARLCDRGLIERRRGSGSYVSAIDEPITPESATQVLLLRALFDPMIAVEDVWVHSLREELIRATATHQMALVVETGFPGTLTAARAMHNGKLAGVAVLASGDTKPQMLLDGTPIDVPRVVLNRPSPQADISGFFVDHERGTLDAVTLLLRLGHRRIVLLAPPIAPNDLIRVGYRRAHERMGVSVDPRLDLAVPWMESQRNWAQAVLPTVQGPNPATAVIMVHCATPQHVFATLSAAGLRVPDDLSLIFLDDGDLLEQATPSISAVAQPVTKMCRMAVDSIARLSRGERVTPANHCLRPNLIIRDSVAGPRL